MIVQLANFLDEGEIDGYMLIDELSHRMKIYASQARSYRDLPLRFAEFGTVYRWEQTGEISGMTRVRGSLRMMHIFSLQKIKLQKRFRLH